MKANRRRDTTPERLIRSELHARGRRFRVDLPIKEGGLRTRPDIVFTRERVAIFVDGCFWHQCPRHGAVPQANRAYWLPKLEANTARDRRTSESLKQLGWRVVRIWEHEPVAAAVTQIEVILESPAPV